MQPVDGLGVQPDDAVDFAPPDTGDGPSEADQDVSQPPQQQPVPLTVPVAASGPKVAKTAKGAFSGWGWFGKFSLVVVVLGLVTVVVLAVANLVPAKPGPGAKGPGWSQPVMADSNRQYDLFPAG